MRIVLSNSSSKWGGVHNFTESLARGLQARGHDVVVFGYPNGMLEERMKQVAPFEPIMKGMDVHPVTMMKAASAMKKHRADIVLALMKKDVRVTVPAARAIGIPSVVRHANDRALDGGVYDRLFFGMMPTHHVANSQSTRDTLLRSAPWIETRDVTVIYNGIDASEFESASPADLGLPSDAIRIGFTGRLEFRKGLMDLAKAWQTVAEKIPKAWLVIAGKGADEEHARREFGNAPRVKWLGYRSDIPSILKSLDVLVVPSHWEGFGFAAAEGMAAGVPVIAANASSLPEIIDDGKSGRLVLPHDPSALASAMIELATDTKEQRRLGEGGRRRILDAFQVGRMVEEYEALLSAISATTTRKM